MACNNKCKQYIFKRKNNSPEIYINGGRWCSICSKFVRMDGLFCLCCGQQFRKNPRNKQGIAIKTIIDARRIK